MSTDFLMDNFACEGSHMKECFEVAKSLTISLRSNSVLIYKPCAFRYCANCRQLYILFYTRAKTHATCLRNSNLM